MWYLRELFRVLGAHHMLIVDFSAKIDGVPVGRNQSCLLRHGSTISLGQSCPHKDLSKDYRERIL